jgi:hypothetical protein
MNLKDSATGGSLMVEDNKQTGDQIDVGCNAGPGAVIGSGSIDAGVIAGRDVKIVNVYGECNERVYRAPAESAGNEQTPLRTPYKALNAFTADDVEDFFGRETLVDELVAALSAPGVPPAR